MQRWMTVCSCRGGVWLNLGFRCGARTLAGVPTPLECHTTHPPSPAACGGSQGPSSPARCMCRMLPAWLAAPQPDPPPRPAPCPAHHAQDPAAAGAHTARAAPHGCLWRAGSTHPPAACPSRPRTACAARPSRATAATRPARAPAPRPAHTARPAHRTAGGAGRMCIMPTQTGCRTCGAGPRPW